MLQLFVIMLFLLFHHNGLVVENGWFGLGWCNNCFYGWCDNHLWLFFPGAIHFRSKCHGDAWIFIVLHQLSWLSSNLTCFSFLVCSSWLFCLVHWVLWWWHQLVLFLSNYVAMLEGHCVWHSFGMSWQISVELIVFNNAPRYHPSTDFSVHFFLIEGYSHTCTAHIHGHSAILRPWV